VAIRRGGLLLGRALADALGVPCHELDVRHPVSRELEAAGPLRRWWLWLVKEWRYRREPPSLAGALPDLPGRGLIWLVDDTSSSGRTLRLARAALRRSGVDAARLCVVVWRAGVRARPLVDVVLGERLRRPPAGRG